MITSQLKVKVYSQNVAMLGLNAQVIIDVTRAFALNEISSGTLILPFTIDLTGIQYQKSELLIVKGELRAKDNSILCSQNIILLNQQIYPNQPKGTAEFRFSILHSVLHSIEQKRAGDLRFSLAMSTQCAIYSSNQMTGFDKGFGYIDFTFSQSDWVKLLGAMGYPSLQLVELPAASSLIPDEYGKSLKELTEARKYFLKCDYNKAIAHCRSAIDAFKPKFFEVKRIIESETEFDWITKSIKETVAWLDIMQKQTSAITSKAHHPAYSLISQDARPRQFFI